MNQDLKIIKKKYGEKMAHFCRDYFPTILETEGLLLNLMLEHFEPSHDLYEDIIEQRKEEDFKNYIYSLVDVEKNNEVKVIKTPEYLLSEVGYDLYECKSEEDIQSFKKYYAPGEKLCTFRGGRLNRCYVFFAIKKNVDKIKREDYSKPQRQDEYGTSVISIQFTRDESHTLSIKNRYNHQVNNPDSTYSNNLDNIIDGLTESFGEHYGLVQQHPQSKFELGGYVRADDGKYYKYNYEFDNVYYCPNNIIIDYFGVKRYDKEKYLVFDYFMLDLVNKKIYLCDTRVEDSFPSTISNIEKIEIKRKEEKKEIKITLQDKGEVTIVLNKFNNIIELDNPYVKDVGNNFLCYVKHLEIFKMANLQTIKNYFLYNNAVLKEFYLPSLKKVGNNFCLNGKFKKLSLNSLQEVGDCFLFYNTTLEELDLPVLEEVGDGFMYYNDSVKKISTPNLHKVGDNFLSHDAKLKSLSVPVLREVGDDFIHENTDLRELDLPNIRIVGARFLQKNKFISELNAPYLESVGVEFLFNNTSLRELNLPNLKKVGHSFLYCNNLLEEVNLPSLEEIGDNFLESHPTLTKEDFIQKIKR